MRYILFVLLFIACSDQVEECKTYKSFASHQSRFGPEDSPKYNDDQDFYISYCETTLSFINNEREVYVMASPSNNDTIQFIESFRIDGFDTQDNVNYIFNIENDTIVIWTHENKFQSFWYKIEQ